MFTVWRLENDISLKYIMVKKKVNSLSKLLIQNFWSIWFLVAVSLILIFVEKQDTLAKLLWQKYRLSRAAIALVRQDDNLAMQIGNYYFGGGAYNLPTAERAFKKALEINSRALGPRYQLSRIYFLKGDFSRAFIEINTEIKNFPDFKRSYYVRGLINGYAKNFPQATSDFEEFLKWDSQSWAAHNDLAWIYFQTGDYKSAERISREGLKWNPDNPWLLNSLGIALLNLNKKTEAKDVLKKALIEARKLKPLDWQKSYPGNNPVIAEEALKKMVENIEFNLSLVITVDK